MLSLMFRIQIRELLTYDKIVILYDYVLIENDKKNVKKKEKKYALAYDVAEL